MVIKPFSNGGEFGALEALYRIFPWIVGIVGTREVSMIELMTQDELPNHSFEVSANGYNSVGKIIFYKDGEYVRDVSWEDIHTNRKKLGLQPTNINSPQTEIRGDEDVCVVVHDHAGDHDTAFNGIHLDIFMCQEGKTFEQFPAVKGWLVEPALRELLRELGLLR